MTREDTTPTLARLYGLSEAASVIRTKCGSILGGNSRAQSTVLGFILIFAVLVTFVGFNQAFAVPAENERTEFQHSQDVRDDIVDLRNSSIDASVTNQQTVANVRLGTDYPNRMLAVNPPEATGTLQTDGGGVIEFRGNPQFQNEEIDDLSGVCGTEDDVETSFLQYEANYNEFDSALPITVENTVVHRQNDDQALLDSGQTIVDGNTIWVVRYAGDFRASGSGVESIDLLPSETGQARADNIESLVLPTKLDESDWDALLEDEIQDGEVEVSMEEDDKVTINFQDEDQEFLVRCTTVGLNEQPKANPSQTQFESPSANFNPRGPNTVELINVEKDNPDKLTFRNRYAFDVTAVEVRIPFASGPGGSQGDTIEINDTPVVIGDSPVGLNNPVQIDSETMEELTSDAGQNTAYGLELVFVESDTGNPVARNMYFIGDEGGEEPEGTGDGFSAVSASDLNTDEEDQEQTLDFTLESGLEEDAEVVIILEDVGQDTGNERSDIDYDDSSGESDDDGEVRIEQGTGQFNNDIIVTYEVGEDGQNDDAEVEITIKDINTFENSGGTYEVEFERTDTEETDSTDFEVNGD